MSIAVRVDDTLYREAKTVAKVECRTIAGQIEFWAKLGKASLDNPDLPIDFIRELLMARTEDQSQHTEFKPGQYRD